MNVTGLLEELGSQLRKLRRKRIRKLKRRFPVDDCLVVERLIRAMNRVRRSQQGAQWTLNESSETTADYSFSVGGWPPCKPEARRKVVLF